MNGKTNRQIINYADIESKKYYKLAGTLLKAESVSKSRRYGINGYKKMFIQHPDNAFSSYMNTFLYLRNMKDSFNHIRDHYKKNM